MTSSSSYSLDPHDAAAAADDGVVVVVVVVGGIDHSWSMTSGLSMSIETKDKE